MKPGLARFGSTQPVNLVEVDMDNKNSPNFKKYGSKFEGRSIPFTIVLDNRGRTLHKMSGYRSYEQLVNEVGKFMR